MTSRPFRGGRAWRNGALACLALTALGHQGPLAAQSGGSFDPPRSPLLLSRTLVRPLPDGTAVTTRRSYAIRISRAGEGYRVDGELVDVTVDAPSSLAALADLERRRPTDSLFPIMLDGQGRISSSSELSGIANIGQAVTVTSQQLGGSNLVALDMLQAQAFVARLRRGGARSQWPEDVFSPARGRRSERRTVDLPGGETGHVVIEITGEGPAPTGQVAAIERVVTTDLAGDTRETRERWTIARAGRSAER